MPSDDSAARCQGVLEDWNDDRGFGFIRPETGGPRAFAHISAFPRGRRPVSGCAVSYAEARDERDRPRAAQVRYVVAERSGAAGDHRVPLALVTAGSFFALLSVLAARDEIPLLLLVGDALLSVVAVLAYAADKDAAVRGQWRARESRLHTIALVGGWPGALVARHVFRHKTVKQPFRTVFWMTVLANCAVLAFVVEAAPLTLP